MSKYPTYFLTLLFSIPNVFLRFRLQILAMRGAEQVFEPNTFWVLSTALTLNLKLLISSLSLRDYVRESNAMVVY